LKESNAYEFIDYQIKYYIEISLNIMGYSNRYSKGILIQGRISAWTKNIIEEHKKNFPKANILVSTWTNENIDNIPCEVIQVDPPEPTHPYQLNVNLQKVGALAGLEKMNCDIIMKCRTDQFIHNKNIFRIYEQSCNHNKIMIPNYATLKTIDYYVSDLCQIATKDVLLDYWNIIPYYDGTFFGSAVIYLTLNYIIRGKKDLSPWDQCLKKYYYVKDFVSDFQIEWEKLEKLQVYKDTFEEWYPLCVKADP